MELFLALPNTRSVKNIPIRRCLARGPEKRAWTGVGVPQILEKLGWGHDISTRVRGQLWKYIKTLSPKQNTAGELAQRLRVLVFSCRRPAFDSQYSQWHNGYTHNGYTFCNSNPIPSSDQERTWHTCRLNTHMYKTIK